jgi:hypothetical protein
MFAIFIGYSFSFFFFAMALGIPAQIDAYLAQREIEAIVAIGRRADVRKAIIRSLRGAL